MKKILYTLSAFALIVLVGVSYVSAQDTATGSSETDITEGSDEIRQKVQEKLEAVSSNPTSYRGGITDITDTVIQVRNDEGEILQVALSEDTTYVNTTSSSSDDIEFDDLAIGDYIVALGYLNGSTVLNASRILVTEELQETNRIAIIGTVVDNDTTGITLNDIIVDPERGVDVTSVQEGEIIDARLTDVEDGDTIIAVGALEGDTLTTRKIQITKKAELAADDASEDAAE